MSEMRAFVVARDGGLCVRCGLPGADTVDHWPVSKVYLEPEQWFDPERCRAAHRKCNLTEGAKLGNKRLREKRARDAQMQGPSREW